MLWLTGGVYDMPYEILHHLTQDNIVAACCVHVFELKQLQRFIYDSNTLPFTIILLNNNDAADVPHENTTGLFYLAPYPNPNFTMFAYVFVKIALLSPSQKQIYG